MIILRYHEIFSGWQHQQPCQDTLVLSAWKKSHDIVILSFCNIVKGQANYTDLFSEYQNLCQILESVFGFGSSFDFIGIWVSTSFCVPDFITTDCLDLHTLLNITFQVVLCEHCSLTNELPHIYSKHNNVVNSFVTCVSFHPILMLLFF